MYIVSNLIGSNLSDRYPLGFIVQVDCVTIYQSLNLALLHTLITLTGQKASSDDDEKYRNLISQCLPALHLTL